MYKISIIIILAFTLSLTAKAQQKNEVSIEHQVADTACVCLSKLDSIEIKARANALKMQCLSLAIKKNQQAINKNFETEKRREEDVEKIGVRGSILIKVQNVLSKECPKYVLFEEKVQVQRKTR